ncbi:MAG: hypothetical protein JSC188_000597 [Candidatus Tokpelaia sp. JSC188]|nr:MAG: hypothetical protein JSC188_000597 [Candidatus Tokpelaia sp. JSC188]
MRKLNQLARWANRDKSGVHALAINARLIEIDREWRYTLDAISFALSDAPTEDAARSGYGWSLNERPLQVLMRTNTIFRELKDESAYSPGAGIAALREQIGEWFKGGNNRLAGFFEGLRCERDERFRESLDRSRELARDIASAIEHFGKAIQRGLGKAREATLKYHRAVERV